MARALVVDDAEASREALVEWLRGNHFSEVRGSATLADATEWVRKESFDLVLLDLALPDGSGLDLLTGLDEQPDAEIVIITGHGTIDSVIEAMRGGAIDYLVKPVDLKRLQKIVARLRRTIELRREVGSLRDELRRAGRFGRIVGGAPAMQRVYDLVAKVAPTSSTVIVIGETGTGKELVAETVHELSRRASLPFLPVNCGAVAPTLIESELFGHERGSFTGADRQHKGIFEQANGGTLFLDEITEMPPDLQVKLLRVLEARQVTRIGGNQPIPVDVRFIAATNRDLDKAVQEGTLREDLLYRLHVFPIRVPPLRERTEDIDLLASYFLERLNREAGTSKRLTPAAFERLQEHAWPGNVRELRNAVERAFIVAGDEIGPKAFPFADGPRPATDRTVHLPIGVSIADAECELILATLEHFGDDKKKAADVLKISLKTLYNRLNSYGTKDRRGGPSPSTKDDSNP